MIIEIETKSGSLAKTYSNIAGPVPRPGDVLANPQYAALMGGLTTALVVEVVYEHTGDTLTARVRCRPTSDDTTGDRLFRLKEHGWLNTRE